MLPKIPFRTKFIITYDKENINYYSTHSLAINLFEKLLEKSNKRCMYCGEGVEKLSAEFKTLRMVGVNFDREHVVERKILSEKCVDKLTRCKFNFGVACHGCNDRKRHGVVVDEGLLIKLADKSCDDECETPCIEYLNVLESYRKNNLIITMPLGLKDEYDEDIVYDTELLIFQLNTNNIYEDEEKKLIYNHIEKFLSHFQKECLDDLITHFFENGWEKLPAKKTILNKNRFKSTISDKLIDFLSDKNKMQRKIIINKIEKKMRRSQGIPIPN